MATIRITWDDPNSAFRQEEEVRIYRDTAPFDEGSLPSILATLATDVEIYEDTTAVHGTSYWYAVGFLKDGVLALAYKSQEYLAGTVFNDTATFGTGVVTTGDQSLIGDVFDDSATFGAGTVSPGTVSISAAVFNDTATFGAGTVETNIGPWTVTANTGGVIGSDLTGFQHHIPLSQIPSAFWAGVRSDGGNIRAYDLTETTEYPVDIISINPEAQTGLIVVRPPTTTAAADTQYKIVLGSLTDVRRSRSHSCGMAATWAGFEAVFMGGEYNANRAKTTGDFEILGDVNTFQNVSTIQTFSDDPHQGMTWDRASGDLYTFDNNKIVRYSSAGSVLATNSDPNGDTVTFLGIGTLGHLCDGTVYDDWIVIPINNFPSTTRCAIAIFDKLTLAFVTATNVSATDAEISSICYRPDTDRLYSCAWGGATVDDIRRWTINSTTGAVAADGALALDFLPNGALQGIEWWNGHFWISDDSRDEIIRLNADGTGPRDAGLVGFDDNGGSVTGNFEGICAYKDGLAFLVDPTSANSYATYARPWNMAMGGGGARFGTNSGYIERNALSGGTTFTLGVSAARSAAKQSALLTYRDFSSGGTNDRATLSHRFVTPNYRVEMWDNTNSWITVSSPVNTALNTMNRIVGVYAGTTRQLYCDGIQIGSGTGITARDADFDCLSIGIDDDTLAESFDGDLTFAYLRLGALSADWIEAEHLMISDPATFFTIT